MSGHDSWEDAADQDENLSRQTQQNLNMNNPNAGVFQPGASSFTPGAQSFQPQQYQQYGGYGQQGYGGYQQYQQYGQGYGYGQQGYGQGGYQQGGYGYGQGQGYGGQQQQSYSQYQQQQGQQQSQQQQFQPPQVPKIAKRPTADEGQSPAASTQAPKAKVLSIGGDKPKVTSEAGGAKTLSIGATPAAAPKVSTSAGGAKTLSIGATTGAPKVSTSAGGAKTLSLGTPSAPAAPKNKDADTAAPAAGAKATAAKAIEKTGEPTPASANTSGSAGKASSPTSSGRNSPTPQEKRANARQAEAVAKEQEAEVDPELLKEMYGKEHVNVIFVGHVDAGKSTLSGSLLVETGMIDARTLEKNNKEAAAMGKPGWALSFAMDTTKEERAQGKTVEVGRGFFETDKRRYSMLDAPGHKTYVAAMIGGASQADVGVLVVSARQGEFEAGLLREGQTREHALLIKNAGINKLIIAITKMDSSDPTKSDKESSVWNEKRFRDIVAQVSTYLKKFCGYNPEEDLIFVPVAAVAGHNIKNRVPEEVCPWERDPKNKDRRSLLEVLDDAGPFERNMTAPFMMPVAAKYRDLGTMVEGKIESGVIQKSNKYILMPNKIVTGISALYGETEDEIAHATCGEQVRIRLRDVEEEDILPGFVLCSMKRPVHTVAAFEAQIGLTNLKSILVAGYNCVLHVHSAQEEVTFDALLGKVENGKTKKTKKPLMFAKNREKILARLRVTGAAGAVCVETFKEYPDLGRITLRDQGLTIGIGKITKLILDE